MIFNRGLTRGCYRRICFTYFTYFIDATALLLALSAENMHAWDKIFLGWLLLLRLASLRVHNATGHQQPPEWLVLGQVDCVGPWQPVGVKVLHCRHPWSSRWSLPIHRKARKSKSALCLHCHPNRVRCRAWIISVSRGWLVWRRTLSLEMKWYHLMPRSIRRHHFTGHWSCVRLPW